MNGPRRALDRVRSLAAGPADPDQRLVRTQALRVGLRIALACAIAVVVLVAITVGFIIRRVGPSELFADDHEAHIALGASDLIEAGILLGVVAILASGIIGLVAARRAISPLADALSRQRRFVADASHELRTPVAVLDMRIQVLARSLDDDDPHRETVRDLQRDARRLGAIITDMLDAVEEDLRPDDAESSDVRAVARAVCRDLAPVAEARDVRLTCTGAAEPATGDAEREVEGAEPGTDPSLLPVPMSATRLARILTAVVDNALKHSPPASRVEVEVAGRPGWAVLTVRDQGPGIRGIEADRVFDRFARSSAAVDGGGSARTGFGIGLALVREAVVRAGGSIDVLSSGGRGTVFEIRLPLTASGPDDGERR
ncbi:HAMP domain-containing histidine kinase [Brachybacterium halotolerans subsp. kimchii]|uniref:sensor histidine kinase n=1 Tax=Brachybacterium halotolerans TaxID=2795215 RepID=UPI001E3223CA|nr:HAMP domain-containing sensor histidine kinase [Brachybacterium halotolerans]UEJ83829.1 HAMP domain-containing histidine kinase [Brachybacterium halotolerans subsp. kimchii]